MKKSLFVTAVALSLITTVDCALAQAPSGSPSPEGAVIADNVNRPNILIIFTDDQRADTIGAFGNPIVKTPHLDRLAQNGVAFKRAYMQGAFTGATCIPSRAMLLSGQSLFHCDTKLMRDETWPTAFGRAGYATFIAGKWHNGDRALPICFQAGRSIRTKGYPVVNGTYTPMGSPLCDLKNGKLTNSHPAPSHPSIEYTDETVRFLSEPHDKPFFCYVPFDGPHDPHIVPDDFPVTYNPDDVPLPSNFMPVHPFDNGEMRIRDEVILPHPRTPEAIRGMLSEYWRYVSFIDAQIGRILDALAASPHADNTIVVFASDSGVARGSHGLIGKQNLYEYDSVRVPLILAGPGIPAGKSTDALCYLHDVLPTLGSMCNVPAPPASGGLDLSGTLQDPAQPGRPELVFAYKDVQRAIATHDWKLIHYPKVDRTQLFDLRNDPYEIHDLSSSPEQAERVREMTALMKQKLIEAGDDFTRNSDRALPEETLKEFYPKGR